MVQVSRVPAALAAALLLAAAPAFAADPYEVAPPYAHPLVPGALITPLVTTGQQVQLTGAAPGTLHRFVGIPDGIGVTGTGGTIRMLVNHEFGPTNGTVAGPLNSGARVAELTLNYGAGTASLVSAKNAIDNVYAGEPSVLQAPGTKLISRLCSGYQGGPWSGLDRAIYFAGEEASGAATFDGLGGSAFALIGGDIYQLPRIGHAPWENVVVMPGTGDKTVVFGLEDASTLNSQFYMYVGDKVPGHPNPLTANGLDNGGLWVMSWTDILNKDEATFLTKGATTTVEWHSVNYLLSDAALETQTQAVGSFNFTRIEDGAYWQGHPGHFYFCTTGRPGTSNPYGRVYRLVIDPANPTAPAQLTLLLDGTEGIVSPDNLDINSLGTMLICEDPNYNLSLPPIGLPRDSYLWRLDLNTLALDAVAELDRPNAISHALAADPLNSNVASADVPGGWEFSGVTSAEPWLGANAWFFDVQAHSLRINPTASTVEGGQVLLLNFDSPTGTDNTMGANVWQEDGAVYLDWSIGSREGLDGFRVLRSASASGDMTDLTPGLLSAGVTQFRDEPGAGDWYYRVEAVQGGAVRSATGMMHAQVGAALSGVLSLSRPVPNPSAGPFEMSFSVPAGLVGTHADLSLFDAAGRRVATLFSGALRAERQAVSWNGSAAGTERAAGVLFARLTTQAGSVTRRVLRLAE